MLSYSRFTLKPKDAKLNREFLESRKDDVKEMFLYACFFVSLRMALVVYNTVTRYDIHQFVNFALWTVWSLLHVAAYLLGRRFKDKYVLMIVSLYASSHLIVLVRMEIMAD